MSDFNLIPAFVFDKDYEKVKVKVNSNTILYVIDREIIIYGIPMYEFKIISSDKKFFASAEILEKYFIKG